MDDEPLKRQLESQMCGFQNHLYTMMSSHRRIETNTRRAMGHAQEAIRLALKLRRLYASKMKFIPAKRGSK